MKIGKYCHRHIFVNRLSALSALALLLGFACLFLNGCGTNPVSPTTIISGSDELFAPKNGDATFQFLSHGESYGSFQLEAYGTISYIKTPQGYGVQRTLENLDEAPASNYILRAECDLAYYYYMITDASEHYAKVFIHTLAQDENGITIGFNWWLQTESGDRNFL